MKAKFIKKKINEKLDFKRIGNPKKTMGLGNDTKVKNFIDIVADEHIRDWSTWEEVDFDGGEISLRLFLEYLSNNLKYIYDKGMKIDEIRFIKLDVEDKSLEKDDLGYYKK